MSPTAPLVLTAPVLSAVQPWTKAPSCVTRRPLPSIENDPARVYSDWPACTTLKKPSPCTARSVARPVRCNAPWLKEVVMADTLEPRPTCAGLVPPSCPAGAPAPRRVWLSTSWKTTELDLKPVVLTLEMLLPTTSIIVWWFRRPEMAENIERIIGASFHRTKGNARIRAEWPPIHRRPQGSL